MPGNKEKVKSFSRDKIAGPSPVPLTLKPFRKGSNSGNIFQIVSTGSGQIELVYNKNVG